MCLSGLPTEHVFAYMDDIVIFTRDFNTHCIILESVLEQLTKFKISLKTSKCVFGYETVDLLGFNLSKDGIKPGERLTEAIRTFKHPECKKEVMRFLDMVNFYRNFIPNCADICKPLHTLTQENTPFIWSEKCESIVLYPISEGLFNFLPFTCIPEIGCHVLCGSGCK